MEILFLRYFKKLYKLFKVPIESEYYLFLGMLLGFLKAIKKDHLGYLLKYIKNPLFILFVLISILALFTHLMAFDIWDRYVRLKQNTQNLIKSGTPIILFLAELELVQFFMVPILFAFFFVCYTNLTKRNILFKERKNNNPSLILGANLLPCFFAYLVYILTIILIMTYDKTLNVNFSGFSSIYISFYDTVYGVLIIQFFVCWFCFIPPLIVLKLSLRKKNHIKLKIISVIHILMGFYFLLDFICNAGGYGLNIFYILNYIFFVGPRSNDGLFILYFMSIFQPFYIAQIPKLMKQES